MTNLALVEAFHLEVQVGVSWVEDQGFPAGGGTGLYMYDLPGIGGGIPPGATGEGIMGGGPGVPSGGGTYRTVHV